ncbi:MAG: hypothetical protein LBG30_00865 [Odoribacteraceae bacterium]|jgi:hypothetical protein|nr:hypothetical protein [Odoribacteraceae bacterium]
MKHHILLFAVALLAAACESEQSASYFEAARLPVESASVSYFPAAGGTGVITITTTESLTVTSDQPWCRPVNTSVATPSSTAASTAGNGATAPAAGTTTPPPAAADAPRTVITVAVDTTASLSERTALITITAGDRKAYLPVTQGPVSIALEADALAFSAKGGSNAVAVQSPVRLTASSDQPWCRVAVEADRVTVTTDVNATMNLSRDATVTVRAGERARQISVNQRPPSLEFAPVPAELVAGASALKLYYECTFPIACTPLDPWIEASVAGDTITFTMTANPNMSDSRQGTVTVTGGPFESNVTLVQRPLIVDYIPDPDANDAQAFMNLKNYNNTTSRYKAVHMSPALQAIWDRLAAFCETIPITLSEFRVEAPRSSYKYSFVVYFLEGTTGRAYYWNSTNGFSTPSGGDPLHDVVANVSGYSYSSGFDATQRAAITGHEAYLALREFCIAATGLAIIQESSRFWLRGRADPALWIEFAPW